MINSVIIECVCEILEQRVNIKVYSIDSIRSIVYIKITMIHLSLHNIVHV